MVVAVDAPVRVPVCEGGRAVSGLVFSVVSRQVPSGKGLEYDETDKVAQDGHEGDAGDDDARIEGPCAMVSRDGERVW